MPAMAMVLKPAAPPAPAVPPAAALALPELDACATSVCGAAFSWAKTLTGENGTIRNVTSRKTTPNFAFMPNPFLYKIAARFYETRLCRS
jgi:hypothetical protein